MIAPYSLGFGATQRPPSLPCARLACATANPCFWTPHQLHRRALSPSIIPGLAHQRSGLRTAQRIRHNRIDCIPGRVARRPKIIRSEKRPLASSRWAVLDATQRISLPRILVHVSSAHFARPRTSIVLEPVRAGFDAFRAPPALARWLFTRACVG
ncbi:hypothetical protein C8R44DRAFT_873617 [Mycena epipterygia]|nr:hypothetical protein C8R44DRAFT_873617 [Mycena epipterygia]